MSLEPRHILAVGALLIAGMMLACDPDPLGPEPTSKGQLFIEIVTPPTARSDDRPPPAAGAARQQAASDPKERGGQLRADDLIGSETAPTQVAQQEQASSARLIDVVRAEVTIDGTTAGATDTVVDFFPNANGTFTVVIDSLAAGTYEVIIRGYVTTTGSELVGTFGQTIAPANVTAGSRTTAQVSYDTFMPTIVDSTFATTTAAFVFRVDYSRVALADGYEVQVDQDPAFSAAQTFIASDTSAVVSLSDLGTYHIRVLATNAFVNELQTNPGDTRSLDIVADSAPTGADQASAPSLGVGRAATGTYTGYNVFPAGEEDWLAIDLTDDATLSVTVLTSSLDPPSPLDAAVTLVSPAPPPGVESADGGRLVFDDTIDTFAIPVSGTYFLMVSGNSGSTGHYELDINVDAPAVVRTEVDPGFVTMLPASEVQLTGRTFDNNDVELFGRQAVWTIDDANIATIDAQTGLVTGQTVGTANVTFESEGVQAGAQIDVSDRAVSRINVSNPQIVLDLGATQQNSAHARDVDDSDIGGKPFTWRSLNEAVATVSRVNINTVEVTAVGAGQAILEYDADGVKGYSTITVRDGSVPQVNFWTDDGSGSTETLRAVWGLSSSNMFAVGDNGTILHNDGTGWMAQTSPVTDALFAIWGTTDALNIVGANGTILHSSDNGATWNTQASPTTDSLFGIWGSAPNDIHAVGSNGTRIHYDGSSWTSASSPVSNNLNAVWGAAWNQVFAVGDNGVLIRYDGNSWFEDGSPTTSDMYAVRGFDNADVFAVGENGTILRWDCCNWNDQTSPTTETLRAVWGASSSADVLAAGDNGTVALFDGSIWTSLRTGTTETFHGGWGSPNPTFRAAGTNGTIRLGSRGASIVLTPNPDTLTALGNTLQMSAEVRDAFGRVAASGDIFTWQSSGPAIASIDAAGLMTAAANGTVTVTATTGDLSGTASVVVNQLAASATLTPAAVTLGLGATVQLTLQTFDANTTEILGRTPNWTSDDPPIASVDANGLVTGVAVGTVTITGESGGVQATSAIVVSDIPVDRIDISPSGATISGIGTASQATATAFDAAGDVITGKIFTWSSRNQHVATVNASSGAVTSVGSGQATVTAEVDGVQGHAVVSVNDPDAAAVNFWGGETTGTTQTLDGVWGVSSDTIFAVGAGGTIVRYDGTGWGAQTSGSTELLHGVWGSSGLQLVAVGANGTVLASSDAGTTWTAQTSTTTEPLWSVWGAGSNDVFAVGGNVGAATVIHYNGSDWQSMTVPTTDGLRDVWGFSQDTVFAVGDNGRILFYDGTAWTAMTSPATVMLTGVWGTAPNNVFAVGANGTIVRYDGTTWAAMTSPTTDSLFGVLGAGPNDVLAVGASGTVMRFDGTTWSVRTSGTATALRGLWSSPNPGARAVGDTGTIILGTRGATVVVTPNPDTITALGNTRQLSAEVQDPNGNVLASGDIFGWTTSDAAIADVSATGLVSAVANGTVTITASVGDVSGTAEITVEQRAASIVVTPANVTFTVPTDNQTFTATAQDANNNAMSATGFTWSSLNTGVATVNATSGAATAVGSGQANIVAERDGIKAYALVTSTIPGTTPVDLWSSDESGLSTRINGTWGTSRADVFAVGVSGAIRHFDGTSWNSMISNTTALLNAVWGTSSSDVFAVGGGGTVMHYDGTTWSALASGTTQELRSVWGTSPKDVFTVGNAGTILRYDGTTWSAMTSGTAVTLYEAWGVAANDVFAVGAAGTILHWNGTAWAAQASGTTNDLLALWGAQTDDVFAAGVSGTTLRYDGTAWGTMTSPNTLGIFGLWGSSQSDVYAVGDQGVVVQWNGTAWAVQTSDVTTDLKAIWGTPNPSVVAAGVGGTILRGSRGTGIVVSPTSISFDALGSTQQITATATDQDANEVSGVPYVWSSTDATVASVDGNGLVTSEANGTATISATVQGIAKTTAVTISQVGVAFSISPTAATVSTDGTVQLTGGTLDANDRVVVGGPAVTWSTGDPAIATVDVNTGLVTGVGVGTVTITATDGTVSANSTVLVTVPNSAVPLAAHDSHSCGISDNGTTYCWGLNNNGQLGDGSTNSSTGPVAVNTGTTFQAVTVGSEHSCGLATDGTAHCWGSGGNGQLGDGTFNGSSTPVQVAGGLVFAEVSAGAWHTCGITTQGEGYCWGSGGNGQLGNGTTNSEDSPVPVSGVHTFRSIGAGDNHTCAVELGGDAYCWGWNGNGQLGDGTNNDTATPLMVPAGGVLFTQVSSGNNHSCAVSTTEKVYCWGYGGNGQLGDGSNNSNQPPVAAFGVFSFRSVSAGSNTTCAVTTTDAALCWGAGYEGTIGNGATNSVNVPTSVSGGLSFTRVAVGADHACGRTTSGSVYCWGSNERGHLGDGSALTITPQQVGVSGTGITSGRDHTCILDSSNAAKCWGRGDNGELGRGDTQDGPTPAAVTGGLTFVQLASGGYHTCGLVASPGDAYCWGAGGNGTLGSGNFNSSSAPVLVTGGHQFTMITAGDEHACGITGAGAAYCWGRNDHGELGNGTQTNSSNPQLVNGGLTFTFIAASGDYLSHTCGLTSDGSAYCWGANNQGRLGDGTQGTDRLAPVAVSGGLSFTSLAVGGHHTCGLTAAGAAFCWGRGWNGQLGNGTGSNFSTPGSVAGGFTFTKLVAGRNHHTCGIRPNGELYCWGGGWNGELGDGTYDQRNLAGLVSGGLTFSEISLGNSHTCGTVTGGTVYCWGFNQQSQLGLGFSTRVLTPTQVTGGITFNSPARGSRTPAGRTQR